MSLAASDALPHPVARYLAFALPGGADPIEEAELLQSGELRVQPEARRWLKFTARQCAKPLSRSFHWNARVRMPLGTHVRVIDSYIDGTASARVSFLSVIRLGVEAGTPQLNAGALHRYLAESVWFPTALLPQSGIEWSDIDDCTALATLIDRSTPVTLEFRFGRSGEVAAVYSPGRWARSRGGYELLPWEGHFRDYREQAGMRIPFYGEVGWFRAGKLQLVWKGRIGKARYRFRRG
ncbi:MAG TPA: DUF6544 family protein, partial [Woeseiaceae bacterium]|nr:DUF6544 family protein [Woeseiaceae bacterium]